MLSIYKTSHSKRVGIVCNTNDDLDGVIVYLIEKIRGAIDQDDINAVLATYMLFHSPHKSITKKIYHENLAKVSKEKVEYDKIKNLKQDYRLKSNEAYFMMCPYDEKFEQRNSIFCSSTSGAGKTVWANKYAKLYQKLHPKNKIYYLSVHDIKDEPSIDIKDILCLDAGKITKVIKKDSLKDSLIIMDDVDDEIQVDSDSDEEENPKSRVKKQKERKDLTQFAKSNIINSARSIVSLSRKYSTSILFISHKLKEINTQPISLGCQWIVVFPYSGFNEIGPFFESRSNISAGVINNLINSSDSMKYEALMVEKNSGLYLYQNRIGLF